MRKIIPLIICKKLYSEKKASKGDSLNSSLHIIVDEAHKIEDGNRGILLQQKIEDVVKANSSIKVFFSSPFTSNPEILLDNVMNNSRKCMVNTQFVAVNQNLLYVSQVHRKIREWQIHLCTIEKTILLGRIIMTDRPTTERHKIVHTAYQTSNKGGCLIYSNGAADAEDTACLLYTSPSPRD